MSDPKHSVMDRLRQWMSGRARTRQELVREMEELIEEGSAEGVIDSEEEEMLLGVLGFRRLMVREVMIPRTEMICLDVASTLTELIKRMVDQGHSRIPVYEGDVDHVTGVAHARDLLEYWGRDEAAPGLRDLLRPAFFVPETMRLEQLLGEFRHRKVHIAVVVDEYGGVSGMVTLEDVLEEIVGDIRDEWDDEAELMVRETAQGLEVDARCEIEMLEDQLNRPLETAGDFETVGGLVFHAMGRIPTVGERFELDGLEFVIRDADNRRVKTVSVQRVTQGEGTGESSEP